MIRLILGLVLLLPAALNAQAGTWNVYGANQGATLSGSPAPNIGAKVTIMTGRFVYSANTAGCGPAPPVLAILGTRPATIQTWILGFLGQNYLIMYVAPPVIVTPMATRRDSVCLPPQNCTCYYWGFLTVTLPNDATLVGQKFYAQAIGTTFGYPVASPGLEMVIGR